MATTTQQIDNAFASLTLVADASSASLEHHDLPTKKDLESGSISNSDPRQLKSRTTLGLEHLLDRLSSQLAKNHPNRYNAPTIANPPFRDPSRVPHGTFFFPPRHHNDGPSSEFLHLELERDPTPRNLLRMMLVHQVPAERLQIPFCDGGTSPDDLCTSLCCPIKEPRKF